MCVCELTNYILYFKYIYYLNLNDLSNYYAVLICIFIFLVFCMQFFSHSFSLYLSV